MLASVEWGHALTTFTFVHEVGHLFGCQHDDRFAVKNRRHAVGYEFGYFIDYPESPELGTIMT